MKKWPKGSNHHQVLETALMGALSGTLVMDRIFKLMAQSDPDWPVARSVAPADWHHRMPFVPEGGGISMGIGRARPSRQAVPRDPTLPEASQRGQGQESRARNDDDDCSPALKRTRIGSEVAPKCYAGSYLENIEAISARGANQALYSKMLDELCSLYGLIEAVEKLYLTARDKLHGYSRKGAWLCPMPYLLVRKKQIFHGDKVVRTSKCGITQKCMKS